MPIVQAGKTFNASDIKFQSGRISTAIRDTIQEGLDFKVQLETWPDADLVALGLAQEEINAIKGFFIGDLPAIADLVKASLWIKQLLGTGV